MNIEFKEKDVNMEEIKRICKSKSVEELDEEWEEFKREFKTEHSD